MALRPRHIILYRLGDDFSGVLIFCICVFSPWAFGTTEHWSTWVMNIGSYTLALLWFLKVYLRHYKQYPAGRWIQEAGGWGIEGVRFVFAAAMTGILLFVLISAWNARARYDPNSFSFIYRDAIDWLPSSLDGTSTWFSFWQYLGLAAFFWAFRDWILGKSSREHRASSFIPAESQSSPSPEPCSFLLPARFRAILWLLCINGALLGIEGIIQRIEGSGRLLFLIRPTVNPGADAQFGPWAYRANAAAFFNLLWPVCLGFWWTLHRSARPGRLKHHLLLICAAIMAACPMISTSRGGAIISLGMAGAAALFLISAQFLFNVPRDWGMRRWATTLLFMVSVLAGGSYLGYRLGWTELGPRMDEFQVGFEMREEMFDVARPMAHDYPWYGTGPGTFGWVFQLYRGSTDAYWPAQLHNDWLETRITFGWVGSAFIAVAFLMIVARWFFPGGIHGGRRLIFLIWLAIAGALVHARWDFPFQIHSILFLFILWCSLLSCFSRRPRS